MLKTWSLSRESSIMPRIGIVDRNEVRTFNRTDLASFTKLTEPIKLKISLGRRENTIIGPLIYLSALSKLFKHF